MTKRTFSLSFFFRKHIVAQYWWWHHHWFRQGHTQEMMSLQFYNTKYQENLLWAQLEHSGEFVFVFLCIIVYYCVLLSIIVYYCVFVYYCAQKKDSRSLSGWYWAQLEPLENLGQSGAFSDCLTFAHNHHLSSFEPKYLQERIKMWWFLTFSPRYLQEWVGGNFSHFDRSFRKIMWK